VNEVNKVTQICWSKSLFIGYADHSLRSCDSMFVKIILISIIQRTSRWCIIDLHWLASPNSLRSLIQILFILFLSGWALDTLHPPKRMKVFQHNTAWLNNSYKGRVAVSRSHSMFSFTQRSRHLSHQADLRCVWGSQMPALPSSWQIMFSISVSALADIECCSYRVLTLVSAPIAHSSSTVTHQRFRTRFNISHNIVFMVRQAMLRLHLILLFIQTWR